MIEVREKSSPFKFYIYSIYKIWYNVFDEEDNNMSKRYDEYINKVTNKMNNNFLTEVIPMVPDVDQKLEREIRDRAIIELVKKSISKGMELTYGDICLMIDDDPSEKEYENIKNELMPRTKQFELIKLYL